MSITSLDGYIAAAKQIVSFVKTASRVAVATGWFSLFELAGNPGAGVLAGTSTAAGVVPTDLTAGCPVLNAFAGAALGYITNIDFGSSVACRMQIFDLLFKAGAYSFNSNVTLAAQPSYAGRVPGGTDFKGTQLWLEWVTANTGTQSVVITYTNQDGVAGKTTGTVVTLAGTIGRMLQIPLAAGDTGIQKIESVVGSVATVGTFNVLVLRPLWTGRCRIANDGDVHGLDLTGMPQVFADSALFVAVAPDSTATGIPELQIEISNA